ncbi:GntR family transcriptional regulator [Propionivibrio dicarboxylicus]|uniref:Transcriptional regulator, GntR family n=1 Tax=Propionivibrio dicarboxylicus TaxID=83767 RepID=A0A1G8N5Y2_9RHOO|nr:GntR family transcriptional regulator [Propionivibrio dicarboxylicus]SDI75701.1 transcriptional regulator, GntR family [Propionivibrio dicarboxylicus]
MERQALHDNVVGHIRDLIVEGILPPGIKLNERALCETLGVSRTPLREAIKVLATEGLVDITPNKGASVSSMSETEIGEVFELMSALEAFSGELACERISPEELSAIKALHYEMLALHARNDLPAYYRCNQRLHDRINEAARNSVLRQTYVGLNRRLNALRFRSNLNAAKWDRAVQEHGEMIKALEARDGKLLASMLRQHIVQKKEIILAELRTADKPQAS